jgi:outer membrane receptor protein involved in Fe transport
MLSLSGGAQAQQSASAAAMLEEVVVTARRREENLQDLPLSIQAITADAMQAQGIYNIQQVTDFVPNVVLLEDQRKNDTRFYVRGVGGGFSNPAQVFGVGMYVDGHIISGSLGSFMSTVDIERVEVLRGPQGTLFGKNTTGGALSMVTAKPGPEFDSYVTLRAAEFGETGVRAMINTPITDNLFFRGNFASEQNDGYYFNKRTGEDTGGDDQQSLGLALRWLVNDAWTIDARLLASYDRDDNQGGQCFARPDQEMYDELTINGAAGFAGPDLISGTEDDIFYNGTGPATGVVSSGPWGSNNDDKSLRVFQDEPDDPAPLGVGGSQLRVDALYPGANAEWLNSCLEDEASGSVYQTFQDANTYSDIDNEMFMLDATWESDGAVGPFESANLQIKSAWRYSSYSYYQDRDFGPGIIDHIGNAPTGSRGIARYTDEFEVIFNGQIGDRVNLTTGFYWLDDKARSGNGNCVNAFWDQFDPNGSVQVGDQLLRGSFAGGAVGADFTLNCAPDGGTFFHRLPDTAGVRRSFFNHGQTTGESTAVYGHVDIALNDQWNLAIGARAMEDERGGRNIEPGGAGVVQNCTNIGNPLNMCTDDGAGNPLTYVLTRDTLIGGGFLFNDTAKYSEVTPTVSLTRQLTPGDTLNSGILYGTISQGYLTGAFNDELNPYNPDFTAEGQALIESLLSYSPEFVTNYELGFKATMADGAVRIASAIFFMDYEDRQEVIEVQNDDGSLGPDPALEYTQNASSVEIKGIEFEMRASLWDGGFLSIDAGMLDTEYADFTYTDLLTGEQVTPALTQIQNRTPDWTVTASVEHAFQLGNGATLTPQLGVYTQAGLEWWSGLAEGERSDGCYQDSFSKWRTRLTYEPADAGWQASLYGYNITDEEILFRCDEIRSGAIGRWYQAPSQYGIEFQMRFGGNN